jgi:hypothetical protein
VSGTDAVRICECAGAVWVPEHCANPEDDELNWRWRCQGKARSGPVWRQQYTLTTGFIIRSKARDSGSLVSCAQTVGVLVRHPALLAIEG